VKVGAGWETCLFDGETIHKEDLEQNLLWAQAL
jgi:hypothetical protein